MDQHLCINNLDFNLQGSLDFCPRLQHVTFSVYPGEHLVLYHPCGLGSSLILYLITGLIQPDSGHICLDSSEESDIFDRISLLTIQGLLFSWRAIYQKFPLCRHVTDPPTDTSICPVMEPAIQQEDELSLIQKLLTTPAGYPTPLQQQMWIRLLQKAGSRSVFLLLDRPFQHYDIACARQCFDFLHTCSCTTILTAANQLSDALLLGSRILFLGGDPVSIRYEYPLPFSPEDTPAMRMNHSEYHRIYKELVEISKSMQSCSGCNVGQSGLY